MPPDPDRVEHEKLPERILASLPGLTRFVRQRMNPELRARESASDIVQSTIRSILQGDATFEDRGEASFQAWLRTAARNKILSRARYWGAGRRRAASQPLEDESSDADEFVASAPDSANPRHEAQMREEVERLRRAFAALSKEQRELLIRSQVHGESHSEIARDLGCAPDTARKAVARAMAQLAATLDS